MRQYRVTINHIAVALLLLTFAGLFCGMIFNICGVALWWIAFAVGSAALAVLLFLIFFMTART